MTSSRAAAGIFDDHRELRAVIEAVLEGRIGRVVHPDGAGPWTTARLDVGGYAFPGGDPMAAEAREIVATVAAPREIVLPSDGWRARVLEVHGPRVHDRPMRAYRADRLDREHLRRLAGVIASGYEVRPLAAEDLAQLDGGLVPHALQTYTAELFVDQGIGIGAFRGDVLASAATSYARSTSRCEIAISTRDGHRSRGLATAVAARMILACQEQALEPCWNAANPVSQRLAVRLGFRPAGRCEILYLDSDDPGAG